MYRYRVLREVGIMCTLHARLRRLYHIVDQDAECCYDPTGASQVPRRDHVHALPYPDVG